MKKWLLQIVITLLLALSMPAGALAQTLNEAAHQAARQYNAKVLSARTINRNGQRIHEIKLITADGVVKTVHIPEGKG